MTLKLDTFLKRLNGHGNDIAALEADLLQNGRDREATRAKIAELNQQRKQMLLDEATDNALDKLERQIDRANIDLERLALSEPLLRDRISALKQEERARRWAPLLEAYHEACREFIASARLTEEKHAAVVAIIDQAHAERFMAEAAASMPPTPNMNGHAFCAKELIDLFEQSVFPPVAQSRPAASPTKPLSRFERALLPHQRRPHIDQGPVYPFTPMARPLAIPTPDDVTQLGPDEVRCIVLRPGFQAPTGQCRAGQKIRLQRGVAEIAALSGAVEIVEAHVGPTPDSERTFHKVEAR